MTNTYSASLTKKMSMAMQINTHSASVCITVIGTNKYIILHNNIISSVVTVAGICNSVGGSVFHMPPWWR